MKFYRWLGAIALGLVLVLAIALPGSTQVDPRISSLEAEVLNQRQRLDRLESQLSNPSRPLAPIPSIGTPTIANRDPLFNRLATLAVELKEDVRDLQAEVKELRQRLARLEGQQR